MDADFGVADFQAPPAPKFQEGDVVEVIGDDSRPFAGVITQLLDDGQVRLKYFEFEEEYDLSISKISYITPGPLKVADFHVGLSLEAKYSEDQNYYDAVVTKLTQHGATVFFTLYGNSEEVPIAYLRPKKKKKKVTMLGEVVVRPGPGPAAGEALTSAESSQAPSAAVSPAEIETSSLSPRNALDTRAAAGTAEEEEGGGNPALKKTDTLRALKRGLTFTIKKSKFKDWKRESLILFLISKGVEIRNEAQIPTITLVDECEKRYRGKSVPPEPPALDEEAVKRLHVAAKAIQAKWRKKRLRLNALLELLQQRRMEEAFGDYDDDMDLGEEVEEVDDINAYIDGMVSRRQISFALGSEEDDVGEDAAQLLVSSMGDEEEGKEGAATASKSQKNIKKLLGADWKPPDFELAARALDNWHPRKGAKLGTKGEVREKFSMSATTAGRHCCLENFGEQCDLWGEGQISEFSPFGVGICNYFKFLKWMYWTFAVLVVVSAPELILNVYNSSSQGAPSSSLVSLSATTVGNLANTVLNGTVSVNMPGCSAQIFGSSACQLNRNSLGTFYTAVDLAISIILLVGFVWLAYFERVEESEHKKKTYYASMFTVEVRNLPPKFTDKELQTHFEHLLENKFPIASIKVAHECEMEIAKCKERGDLLRARTRMLHEHRYLLHKIKNEGRPKSEMMKKINDKNIEFLHRLEKKDLEIQRYDRSLGSLAATESKPLIAYITFEDRLGALLAIDKHTTTLLGCMSPKASKLLRFKKYRLRVNRAPEPAKIIWENLGYGVLQRLGRRLLTIFLAMMLVVISVAITFGAKVLQQTSINSGGTSLCPNDFASLDTATQISEVAANKELLHCYCDGLSYQEQAKSDLCKGYLQDTVKAQVLTFFSSVVVLVVSSLIEYAIRRFAEYEKHHTEDSKEKSIFFRLFLMQYLNTSCVFLINNNQSILKFVFGMSSNANVEFSASWYDTIGVTVMLVQFGNILSCQSTSIYNYLWYHARIKAAKQASMIALTQSELNKLYVGPPFELSYRYAQLMSTFFVCLTFSSGMPLLYAIAAANFVIYYVIDKYVFINLCCEPKPYNADMGKEATMLIPLGIALHLAMSVWVLSNKEIFSSDANAQISSVTSQSTGAKLVSDLAAKASFRQTAPLFSLFCIIIAVYILYQIIKNFRFISRQFSQFIVGNSEVKSKIEEMDFIRKEGYVVQFSKLVYTNKIKGLSSYNVLQNPEYKEAFGITWSFAFKHQKVKSVLNLVLTDQSPRLEEEYDDLNRFHANVNRQARANELAAAELGSRSQEAASSPAASPDGVTARLSVGRAGAGGKSPVGIRRPTAAEQERDKRKTKKMYRRFNSEMLRNALVVGDLNDGQEFEAIDGEGEEDEDAFARNQNNSEFV